jgi:hypothetical protein
MSSTIDHSGTQSYQPETTVKSGKRVTLRQIRLLEKNSVASDFCGRPGIANYLFDGDGARPMPYLKDSR